MNRLVSLFLFFMLTSNIFAMPTIIKSVSSGTTFKFTETLSEKLPTGYKVKIDLSNGKGLVAMTCSGTTCTFSSSALPKADTSIYKVGVYNAKGQLQGTLINENYVVSSTATPLTYTKISNTGTTLPDTAALGNRPNDWACTKDNKSGLIWEIKTTDGGLRDIEKNYTNYFVGDNGYGDSTNIDEFVKIINSTGLCGAKNWRLPTNEELKNLIYCSDEKYNVLGKDVVGKICTNGDTSSVVQPTINSTYFPNTVPWLFWSSSPSSYNDRAWLVGFGSGATDYYFKSSQFNIRLVH